MGLPNCSLCFRLDRRRSRHSRKECRKTWEFEWRFFLESHHGFVPAHLLAIWRQWAKRAFFPKKKKVPDIGEYLNGEKKTNIHQGLGFFTKKSLSPDSSEVFSILVIKSKKGLKSIYERQSVPQRITQQIETVTY